jgi:hypothetical protein
LPAIGVGAAHANALRKRLLGLQIEIIAIHGVWLILN